MRPAYVPPGPLLIDTDVFSVLLWQLARHQDWDVLVQGHLLALSFATIGELRAGALNAKWGQRRVDRLEQVLAQYVVLTATDAVTRKFAEMYARFRGRLKGGGVNDMWTAACALAQPRPLPVATGNHTDFLQLASEFPLVVVHPDL